MDAGPGLDAQAAVSAMAGYVQRAPATARSADSPTARRRHALREGGNAHPHRYDCVFSSQSVRCSQTSVVDVSSGDQQARPTDTPTEWHHAGKAPGTGGALARSRGQLSRRRQASLIEFRPEDKPLREGAATNASRSPGNRSGSRPVPRSLSM